MVAILPRPHFYKQHKGSVGINNQISMDVFAILYDSS